MSAYSPSVLVVDDCSVNRLLVSATLRREGYRILEATDGGSGLEVIAREHPELVILDLQMPEMDGTEMMRRLRERSGASAPRVLLMTALDETESAAKAREIGADAHLAKPFAPLELRARVKELLTAAVPEPRAGGNA
jgi:CheY-like chemotaxis protein